MKKRSITLIALLFLGSFTFSTISRFFHTSYLNLMGKKPSLSATILPELFWNKTWGGSGGEGCLDIAIDSQNNIYLVGYTRSYGAGDRDIALVKFDPSGVDLWYRTWGTTGFEVGYSLQIDSFDNIYIAGTSDGRHALIKYSNDGEELWNKTWRAYAYEFFPSDIVLDSSDNVYFCGKGKEWNEYFLGKFDSLGNLLWNQTWKEDYGRGELGGIDLDSNGNIYTLGKYYGRFKAYRLFKFNTSGDLTWDILWGEGEDLVEYGWANLYDIKCDSVGNIFLGGYRGFEYNGDLQYEFLLLKYNGSGTQVWNKTYGDLYHQFCLAITVDKYDNIYMLGDTDVNDNEDLLLIKVDNSGTFLWDYIWETPSGEPWNSGLALDDLNNIYLGGVCSPGDMFLLKLHVFYLKINKPLSNTTYGLESPSFELELDTEYVHSTWYTLNDGSKYFFLGESGKINQTEWDLFEDGTINIKFYANDTLGYVDCIQVIVGKDTIKPSLDVLAPSAYQLYGNHSPNFIVSVDDPNLDSSWYTLDGGLSNHTFTGFWNTINQVAWDACGNGTVTIEFYANDTAGNIAFQELIVRKDINAPYIRILSPQSLKIYPNKSLNFEIEIYGSDIDATWYNLNDGSNYLFSGTYGTINNTAWGPCLDGINFLKFFVNDSSSRTVFQDILIYKDSILPIIDIISPIQDQYFLDSIPTYEVDIFDTNLNATWYSLDNGQTNYTFSESLGTINQTAWESLLNGYVNLTFYAIDHAGNIGYNVVTIFKNQTLLPKNAYAIIIGISNYPGSDYDLNYCDDDAIAVYNMIVNDYNFKSEHVIYLEDTNATKSSINNAFDSISSVIKPNDVFFFYYSGHGGRGTYSTQGTWNVESLHPYWNDYDQIWSVSHPEAIYMRAHFERFQTEPDYDFLLCGGWGVTQGYYYELLTGDLGYNFWSNYIPVSNYFIRFISDSSNPYPYYGFKIDKYEAILEDGTHYLCSYDSIPSNPSAYYMDSLIDSKLDSLNCADKYVVVDACNSGGLIPEVQDIGRYIMTACENDEESLETPSLEHGIFTYYLLESQENADDQNEDGVISMEECYDYVYSNTVSHSGSYGSEYRYHPQEYDGISGESVLYPSIGSVNISTKGNEMHYSFYLYGNGLLKTLNITVCSISPSITFTTKKLRDLGITPTGFGYYDGFIELDEGYVAGGIQLLAEIEGNSVITIELAFGDSDGDGLSDFFEILNSGGLDPSSNDTDEDGLNDFDEFYGPTDPLNNDTDTDGLLDGEEVNIYNTDPLLEDSDVDGLTDYEELMIFNTNPLLEDTDTDGLTDYEEIMIYNTDPSQADSDFDGLIDGNEINIYLTDPLNNDTDSDQLSDYEEVITYNTDPLQEDCDLDGLTDYEEVITYNTDPLQEDTDSDGLTDGEEVNDYNTDPLNDDTDSDTIPDGWEVDHSLDPITNDTALDPDMDLLINLMEYQYNTHPFNNDTDSDGLMDGIEVYTYDTSPTIDDTDSDGLLDGEEVNIYNTDPLNNDSDSDGLLDGLEVNSYGTDPLNDDTDFDTMPDYWEVVNSLDPLVNDTMLDPDLDNLINIEEYSWDTDPQNPDTDGDSWSDGDEVLTYGTDSLDPNDYPTFPEEGIPGYEPVLIIFTLALFIPLLSKKVIKVYKK